MPPIRKRLQDEDTSTPPPSCTFWCQGILSQVPPTLLTYPFITPSMRDSALIQHDNGVLHVPVHKIHTEVGAVGGTPWAPLNRTVNFGGRTR